MEALYTKLYDKYTTLKKKKLSELDEVNRDQEVKFLNYVSAAEELIQHLIDENEKLHKQISDMRSEVASIRSAKDEQCAEYQKLLMEENRKNKMLHEEVENLRNRLQDGLSWSPKDGKNGSVQQNMLETDQVTSGVLSTGSVRRMIRKRSREARAEMAKNMATYCSPAEDDGMARESAKCLPEGGESAKTTSEGTVFSVDVSTDQQAECCKRTVNRIASGVASVSGPINCHFQALIEYLVGMKLSPVYQTEGICISALHQSSDIRLLETVRRCRDQQKLWKKRWTPEFEDYDDRKAKRYSFSLTWVNKAAGEEPELLYRLLTLGTFERVAPEWMRSVLMFSMSRCPVFFERVACDQAASLMVSHNYFCRDCKDHDVLTFLNFVFMVLNSDCKAYMKIMMKSCRVYMIVAQLHLS